MAWHRQLHSVSSTAETIQKRGNDLTEVALEHPRVGELAHDGIFLFENPKLFLGRRAIKVLAFDSYRSQNCPQNEAGLYASQVEARGRLT